MSARAAEIADLLREQMSFCGPAFEPVLALYAVTLVRIERSVAALDASEGQGDYESLGRLREDLRRWMQSGLRLATALGLTPASAVAISRDTTADRPRFHRWDAGWLEAVSPAKLTELRRVLDEVRNDGLPR